MKKWLLIFICLIVYNQLLSQKDYYYSANKKIFLTNTENKYVIEVSDSSDFNILSGITKNMVPLFSQSYVVTFENTGFAKQALSHFGHRKLPVKSIGDVEIIFTGEILLKPKTEYEIHTIMGLSNGTLSIKDSSPYNTYVMNVSNWDSLFIISNSIYESGMVEYCHPNFIVPIDLNYDPLYGSQYYLNNTNNIDINAPNAWLLANNATSVKIAVIDEGVEEHEDLANKVLPGMTVSYSNDRPNTYGRPCSVTQPTSCWHYSVFAHGEACAGIIAADHNNNKGIKGVIDNAQIVPINIFNNWYIEDYSPYYCYVKYRETVNDYANAINAAWNTFGCDVLNNSWTCHATDPNSVSYADNLIDAINNAITYGRNGKGAIVVFGSGNDYQDCSGVSFPANVAGVIAVGAINANTGTIQSYSGRGLELSLVAPTGTNSNDLVTCDRMGILGYNTANNGHYTDEFGGTSAACPQVSGVAALMLSVNPNLTSQEVTTILQTTARDWGTPGFDTIYGYGLLDAHKAVLAAAYYQIYGDDEISLCDNTSYTVINQYNQSVSDISFLWTCSENIRIVSGGSTGSVIVKGVDFGNGWLSCRVIHAGDTVSSTIDIQVVENVETVYKDVTLTSGMSFPSTFTISGTVDIASGTTITWTDKNVHFTKFAHFIIRPGGKLIADGGTLTSACEDLMWRGIEIVGDRTKQQLAQYQGTVELKNGARIENAMCAIRMGLREDTVTFATAGGIISATNATFKNNRQSVVINSYAYTAPLGGVADYNSIFSRCTFTIDNSNLFAANNTAFAEHVRMWDVKGVTFEGCDFSNNTTNQYWNGRGICAEDAGVSVSTCCPPQPTFVCKCPEADATYNYFSGFTTAVEVNTTGNPYTVRMDECRFSNNGIGVRINGNQFATVTRCQFNLDHHPDHTFGNIGLVLNGSTGYTVEENLFERTTYPSGPNLIESSIGIAVSNSGISANSVYRNVFNNLTKGITVVGNNGLKRMDGLQMTCNHFEGNKYDIYLESGATVCEHQGSSAKGADNEFHNTSVNISNFYNPEVWRISYYYYNSNTDLYPAHSTGVDLTTVSALNSCPSTLCDHNNGGGIYLPLSGFASQVSAYASAVLGTDDDGLAGAYDYSSLQALRQTLSDTYYAAVREIMSDTVLDLNELEQWHAAAQPIGDPYSLTETRFMLGNSEPFTADAEDAELSNYVEFHAMKLALVNDNADNDNNDNADNQDNNNSQNSQNSPMINWYSLTESQIAQLQTIAERNTGRASVMAKGVLCFFHGICYEDDLLGDDNADNQDNNMETRSAKVPQQEGETNLTVYPNPADDVLFIELRGGAGIANVGLYDLQGRAVGTRFIASATGASATVNMRDIPAGVYVLRVTDMDGKEYHQKIVRK